MVGLLVDQKVDLLADLWAAWMVDLRAGQMVAPKVH